MAATFLRKYGVPISGTSVISIPLIKAGVTNFAIGSDWTPVASDVVVSCDGGTWGNIANLPIARTAGNAAVWDFILTGTETQASQTCVMISDAVTKAIEDDYFIVEFFGNVSGMHTIDYSLLTQDSNGYLYCDIASVSGTRIQSPNTPGMQRADVTMINGAVVDTNLPQFGVNVASWSGVNLPFSASDSSRFPKVDVVAWSGTILPFQSTAGVPDINVKNVLGATAGGSAGYLGTDWAQTINTSASISLSNTSISGINYNVGGNVNGFVDRVNQHVNVSGINVTAVSGITTGIFTQNMNRFELAASGYTLGAVVLENLNSSVVSGVMSIFKTDNSLLMSRAIQQVANDSPIRSIR